MRTAISIGWALVAAAGTLAAGTPSTAPESSATIENAAVVERIQTFSNTFADFDELSRALESAVVSGDADLMRQIAVTEEEFRDLVWPTLDIAKLPNSNFTWEFVWSQHQLQHEKCLMRTSHDLAGSEIDIVDIMFEGRTTDHGSFKIHRDSRVEVRRADGTKEEMALFGSLLETADGRYKIYSFIND
jgi:hypothetical protein